MGVEMHVLCPVSFYGETFKSKYELQEAIKTSQEGLDEAKAGLYKLAYMTDPSKFMDKDYDGSPEMWIDERVKAIIHDIGLAEVDLYKYRLLLEYWDNFHDKDGNTITIPKEMRDKKAIWEYAFGEGDWLDLVYPDGKPVDEDDCQDC
jgi:hypothetical protein